MSDGTVLQRLTNMQSDLLSIEQQCIRENVITWPLVAVMHELEDAVQEYTAKAYRGAPIVKPTREYL